MELIIKEGEKTVKKNEIAKSVGKKTEEKLEEINNKLDILIERVGGIKE